MIEVGPPAYTGKRRAGIDGQPRFVFAAVLVVVALVVVLLRVLTGGAPQPEDRLSAEPPGPLVPTGRAATAATTGPASPAGSAGPRPGHSASPSASPAASAAPSTSVSAPAPAQSSPSAPGSPSATGTAATSIEAEAAANRRPSQMTVREVSTASGGRAVTGIGNNRTLTFTGVTAQRAGEVTLTVGYLSTEDRSCWLRAGRGNWQQVRFPSSGAWDRVATVTLTVRLEAGQNTIEAGNTTGRWCPDLDRITVAPR
ncbi:carbohydrate-binding protein [Dactylosporangium aurantiacum]|uniref:Carbohydrate-binding protein n=1 Tax=Dactylosporangium aurantiacum TaxID=35754 RepID=A0A9Q9ICG2_9ACTN|nr:carbohydrate-binding protein [Dactylosporangium aurantiacum]MDG6108174.1 carbohydrate-binding protein [Dactylosporangium aurantiacum]UWZ53834.1 carbohydrate-binding protein [Dactylosporangium aurantiacum]